MKAKTKFIIGQRVILKANRKEGWPEERGIFEGTSGRTTAVVQIDDEFIQGPDDDGLREVSIDQLRAI
jgi:hypothetical protein